MNTYFKVKLENELRGAAVEYLRVCSYFNGDYAMTKKGKYADRLEYTKPKENARLRLRELLDLNFPEFIGRFGSVDTDRFRHSTIYYIQVMRKTPEE